MLERAGDLVTRDELRARLWPAETFVDFEHGLNTAVRRLRGALGDSADAPTYIETLPRRGYRFIGTIDVPGDAATPPVAMPGAAIAAPKQSFPRAWIAAGATGLGLALTAAALSGFWTSRSNAATWLDPKRLTFDDGRQMTPSFSPDGATLAYAGNPADNFDIWTQRVGDAGHAAGNPVRVTTNAAHDWQPDWSPNGNEIAFRSERGAGGIFVVPATGGAEDRLTDFGYLPQWSPDGRTILFTESILWRLGKRLYIVDRTSHDVRTLPATLLGAFGWRPHSCEVVTLGLRVGSPVRVRSVDTSVGGAEVVEWTVDAAVTHRFRDSSVLIWADRLYWSADARTISFVGEVRGVKNLWRVDVDVANRRVTGGPYPVTTVADASTFSVASAHQRLAIERSTRTAQLWSYELDAAGRIREDRAEAVTPEAEHAILPDVSADGARVVFVRAKPGSEQQRDLSCESSRQATSGCFAGSTTAASSSCFRAGAGTAGGSRTPSPRGRRRTRGNRRRCASSISSARPMSR